MNVLNIVILVGYTLASFLIAKYCNKSQDKSFKSYSICYKSVSGSILAASILASTLGAGSLFDDTFLAYSYGMVFLLIASMAPISWLISSKLFSKSVTSFRNSGALSVSHIMGQTYGNYARWLTSITAILRDIASVATQMYFIAYVLNNALFIPEAVARVLSLVMVMGFSLLGGIRTITLTGVFQSLLFFMFLPLCYVFATCKVGGIASLNRSFPMLEWGTTMALDYKYLAIIAFLTIIPDCSSSFVQKCLIARSESQLEESLRSVGLAYIPIMISLFLITYLVRVANPSLVGDNVLIYFLNDICPFWLKGGLSVAIIAIIMGMSDGILHADSVIIANDIWRVLRPNTSDKVLIKVARSSIAVVSLASFYLINPGVDTIWNVSSFWFPIVFVPLVSAFIGFKAQKLSFLIATFITGILIAALHLIFKFSSHEVLASCLVINFLSFFGSHIVISLFRNKSYISGVKAHLGYKYAEVKSGCYRRYLIKKDFLAKNLFPNEDNMVIGHKLVYSKFVIMMTITLFSYSLFTDNNEYILPLSILLGLGFLAITAFVIRELLAKRRNTKLFYSLWYAMFIIFAGLSSYALFSSSILLVSMGTASLMSLLIFTNASTYGLSISGGFMSSFVVHYAATGEFGELQYFLIYGLCLLSARYLRGPQEEVVKEKISSQELAIGVMGHELLSPQAAALMSSELVVQILNDADKHFVRSGDVKVVFDEMGYNQINESAANAIKSNKKGIKTVKILLAVAKSGKLNMPKEAINVSRAVGAALDEYCGAVPYARSRVNIDIDEGFRVFGMPDLFIYTAHNFIKNSFVHGKKADIEVKIYNEGRKLVFEDNGVGIPKEQIPFVFDKFYTQSESGTGIGLALSKSVAEDMNALIICESQVGEHSFTRFSIVFPEITT